MKTARDLRIPLTILAALAALPGLAASPDGLKNPRDAARAEPVLEVLGYEQIRLLPSYWRQQQRDVLDYYLAVPTDDYLKGFRERAGTPAPGAELGGWYSHDVFNTFGQIVSGLARLHAATGREDARAKVDELVDGFVECLDDDGFCFYSDTPNAPHYEYDKFLGGLLDAWLYCGNQGARRAMDQITDWAVANLDRDLRYKKNDRNANSEAYTLSENLYRAYLATGDPGYRDFGKVWEYRTWWDQAASRDPAIFVPPASPWMPWHHAYSHVNALGGLALAYRVGGDPHDLDALVSAHDFLRETQTYAPGGFGPFERLMPRARLADAIRQGHHHFETQCGSWAVFKLCKSLLELNGDACFGDWAEQMVYNGVGASIPMSPDGRVQYFSNYSSRGSTKENINPWSCCTGTRPQAVSEYSELVFLKDEHGLYVNLFLPAEAHWETDDGPAAVRLETDFPASETVLLVIEKAPAAPLSVGFRTPEWLDAPPEVQVNGQPVPTETSANWAEVSRAWAPGDEISVRLPMQLRWKPFLKDKPWPVALTYGPVALVLTADSGTPDVGPAPEALLANLQPDPDRPLLWHLKGQPGVTARPFYEVPEGRTYYLYLDPSSGPYIDLDLGWKSNDHGMHCATPGASATVEFEGTGIRWLWEKFDDAGFARVEIDGEPVATIDQYGPGREIPSQSEFTGLPEGPHEIRVICTGEKNPKSRAPVVNILDFEPIR